MADANRNLSAAVDRATAAAGMFSRRTLAWAGVVLAAVTLLSVNLVSSTALRSAKIDLTKEKLFTISEGTRAALRSIDESIDVKVYFSKKLGELAPQYAKAFERVKTMLDRYRDISRGKLNITYYDPEPFSDAEERAVASGLKGIRLNQEGEMGYFGIYGTNSTDTETSLPFLAIERERFLEYDVTKLIVSLAHQTKTTVGLISGIKLEGDPGNPMFGKPPQPGPLMMEHIKEFFTIKPIAKDAKEIPSDVGVLMVVQPDGLSPDTAYAIDQFALNGGKVLAFVDPVAETTRQGGMFAMMQPPPDLSEFGKLLKSWGVAFDATKVAADKDRARRVQFNSGGGTSVTSYVLWLALKQNNLDQKDVVAGDVKELNFASAGILAKAAGASTQFTPLVFTTPGGMQVPAEAASLMPDPKGLLKDYKPGGVSLTLAARVAGEAKSAFPEGAPKAPPPAKDKSADKAAGDAKAADKADEKAAKAADKKGPTAKAADKAEKKLDTGPAPKVAEKKAVVAEKKVETAEKAPEPADKKADPAETKAEPTAPAKPHTEAGKVNVIVVADTDFLQDQFWLDVREYAGQQMALPYAHNGAFVLAALENLTGSDALISLRARGVADRPFEVVNTLRREAEARFLASEQALTERLKEVRAKLSKLQREGSGELVLTDKDQKEIEKFRAELIDTQRELRAVKRELRRDIDRLDGVLKFFNIAAVPLLIGLVSVGLAYRRRRPTGPAQATEGVSHDA